MAKRQPSWRGTKTSSTARGYGYQWQQARKRYLEAHPYCVKCDRLGRVEPSTIVDHRVPHRGDQALFWDENNWQALCEPHHNGTKQAEEKSGIIKGTDVSGRPIDPHHPWNARQR